MGLDKKIGYAILAEVKLRWSHKEPQLPQLLFFIILGEKMKKVIFAVLVFLAFVSSAQAGEWTSMGVTKDVSMAGTGGLDVAARKCADKVGTDAWQACVAHHDGLYTLNRDGSVSRNYVRAEKAPKPHDAGEVVCTAGGFVNKNGQIVYEVPENPKCRVAK